MDKSLNEDMKIGVADMTDIPEIDDTGINNNLKLRYKNEIIYSRFKTYTGSILVAVNPYKTLDIFNKDYVSKYHGHKIGTHEPHVFALAEASYRSIIDDDISQSVVISGESGAGKTETTKFVLQYLCAVTTDVSTWIQQQILEANTILEAFGNAKTIRNDNSSRFGKFMQVCFDSKHCIKGCVIQDYLLEQSRITFQSMEERNYHVLYQLVAQGERNPKTMRAFNLKPLSFYRYLNASGNNIIDIECESKKFEALTMAFTVLQITQQSIDGVFKVLSAILWLGNLEFRDIDGERCDLSNQDEEICQIISNLLGLNSGDLLQVLLWRQINVRGNITEIPHKLQEARENRHAMSKALYSKTFSWLVSKINSCTNPGQDGQRFLGVLDIFGFENFSKNSFEQLCINYTNEKLHKFFNHYVFALEQEIYRQEEILYSHVEFTDNSMCLELIERPPRCIFKLLTEQCHMPKGSDTAYLSNMHLEFEYNPYYIKGIDRRHWETEFGIKHYAGSVIYNAEGFVEKNRDVQQDVLFNYMTRSNNMFVKELSSYQETLNNSSTTMQRGTSKAKITVSDNFRQQLQMLIDVLQNTKPWYVRCIKPNAEKMPNKYNEDLVLDQLKYLGMLDIIRIRREGFPIHFTFDHFINKYRSLLRDRKIVSAKLHIEHILNQLDVPHSEWQIGISKVFLRPKAYEPLEDKRKYVVHSQAVVIQRNWKRYIQIKNYNNIKNSALKIQHAYRGWKMRIQFLRMRRAAVLIQSHLRGVYAREVASALREMRRVDEEMKKRQKSLQESIINNEAFQALENCEKMVEEEMKALSYMADQINDLRTCNNLSPSKKIEDSNDSLNNESVDLDNLFAFLSDIASNNSGNPILDELTDKIDNLVQDFDVELGNPNRRESDAQLIKVFPSQTLPSLPEPSVPPPPPPFINPRDSQDLLCTFNELKSNRPITNQSKPEPIYEAVLIVNETQNHENVLPHKTDSYGINLNNLDENILKSDVNVPIKITSKLSNSSQNSQDIEVPTEREQRRKYRVEKKILEMHQKSTDSQKDLYNNEVYYNITEFAEQYFNTHEKTLEGTIIATLTRKNKKSIDQMPKFEMTTFLKGDRITTSHIHMYDPENIVLACNIFRELCKYMKGELNPERELQTIQYIIGLGIEREELRDEIFIQCVRQTNKNPNLEWTDRLWLLLCLVIVAFQPSKLLFRYFVSYIKKSLETLDGKLQQYAQWCFDNCKCTKVSSRLLPPSSVEVAAMKRLGTIVCRFFFLDGRTKAIDVHPTDTAGDAVLKLAEKLNLSNTEGWAIFQSHPSGEEHIKSFDYLYDVIAAWESKQIKLQQISIPYKRLANGSSSGENRFVFKKRLFKSTRELSQDPVEVNLLYAQAVYSVVKCDEFPVSEKVALQLAGLQAQVALGDPSNQPKPEYYMDVHNFLPERISKTREQEFWVPILVQAHRQYGASRNELTAKVLYLSCVMQYPLYGTTMFNVIYKGFWNHGNNIIFGINYEGIMFIQPEDKFVLYQFKYIDIESIMLDPSDSFITLTLNRQYVQLNKPNTKDPNIPLEAQRCFVFETTQKTEIGSLIVSYYPALSNWIMNSFEIPKKSKSITNEDRARLYQNIIVCRRQLIDMEILRKPQDTSGGFFRNTLRKLSKHRLDKLRAEQGTSVQEHGETYKGFPHSYWAFSRLQITQSLSKLADQEETVMVQVFQAILTYSGLGVSGETVQRAEDEHVTVAQSIMDKCMRKESLINELYLQLIKQTTDHPDPNSRINLRHWALLSLACSVVLPPVKNIRKYLISHLKRCASDYITEEGKYARFAEKCFFKTQATRRRQWSPSREEIICTVNRRPCYSRFHFMDGQFYSVEFHPSSTALEVIELIKKKIGLQENAMGYAIYEVVGNTERSLLSEEKITDVMAKWEKYRNATQHISANSVNTTSCRHQHYMFLFKKHLFYDNYINIDDPVEKELLYHQVLHCLRTEKFPITEMEAVMLTALQGQLELGDCGEMVNDYRIIASHCLPPRFVPNIPHEAVAMHHQSLRGMSPSETKKSFLNLIQSWPLHRATIFDVMQTFTSNWPRVLWLAVDQSGIHLLEHRSRNILCTHDYESIMSYCPNMNSLMIFTGTERKQSKVILSTSQAFQIATLIKEYSEIVKNRRAVIESSS